MRIAVLAILAATACGRSTTSADPPLKISSDPEHPERELLIGVLGDACGREDVRAQLERDLKERSPDARITSGRVLVDGLELVARPRACDTYALIHVHRGVVTIETLAAGGYRVPTAYESR